MHLDDEVFRVLQAAGVADAVLARSRPMAGLRLLDGAAPGARRVRAGDPGAGTNGWPQGSLVHQPDLEDVLAAAAEAAPGDHRPAGRRGHRPRPGRRRRRTVGVREGGADRSVRAAAVLGCDGAGSTVRALIGASMRDLGPPDRWLVLDVRSAAPLPVWPGAHQVCDSRAAGDVHAGHRRPVPLGVPPGAGGDGRRRHRAGRGWPRCSRRSTRRTVEIVRAVEYTFRAQVADRWRAGRVFLAGDAAHLSPPFVGQGLGLGLRDVHQLAWKLAAVLAGRGRATTCSTPTRPSASRTPGR